MKKPVHPPRIREDARAQTPTCPLSRAEAGMVCVKKLVASAELSSRLRELGFCEEQNIKLLKSDGNVICQVCGVRLGISAELADAIIVQAVPRRQKAA